MSRSLLLVLTLLLFSKQQSIPDEPAAIFYFTDGKIYRNDALEYMYVTSRIDTADRFITSKLHLFIIKDLVGITGCNEAQFDSVGLVTTSAQLRCGGVRSSASVMANVQDLGATTIFAFIQSTADDTYYPILTKYYVSLVIITKLQESANGVHSRLLISQKISSTAAETEFKLEFLDSSSGYNVEADVDATFTGTIAGRAIGWVAYGFTFSGTSTAKLFVSLSDTVQTYEIVFNLGANNYQDHFSYITALGCDIQGGSCIDAKFKKAIFYPGASFQNTLHFLSQFIRKYKNLNIYSVHSACPDCNSNVYSLCEDETVCMDTPVTTCGNLFIEYQEECDDGNSSNGDGCSSTCQIDNGWYLDPDNINAVFSICGDGIIATGSGEACDDHNTNAEDGCSPSCSVEAPPEFDDPVEDPVEEIFGNELPDCSNYNSMLVCLSCNDAKFEPEKGERCDPSAAKNFGGCTDCKINDGYECQGSGTDQHCFAICGDGRIIHADHEGCDDGNTEDGDGCHCVAKSDKIEASRAVIQDGWECPTEGQLCVPTCGDGSTKGTEVCDSSGGDGCDNCETIEVGWTCPSAGGACSEIHGDGLIVGTEECDDGATANGDGCSSTCTVEDGYECNEDSGASQCREICGDGKIIGNEVCDDGDTNFWDGCAGNCLFIDEGYECPTAGSACNPKCGDGIVITPIEECDDQNSNQLDGCHNCAIVTYVGTRCGDGVISELGGEDCDVINNQGCIDCEVTPGWECSADMTTTCWLSCGDGTIDSPEACDDGNKENGDGCNDACAVETYWECPTPNTPCNPICGDGVIIHNEFCDDGNTNNSEGCATCSSIITGYACPTAGFDCHIVCGDGILLGPEVCDDGNTNEDDGCQGDCSGILYGWECPTPGVACHVPCGDGILVDTHETCDDGANDDDDGCSGNCQEINSLNFNCIRDVVEPHTKCVPICGDGLVFGEEECDDENTANKDGCSEECKIDVWYVDCELELQNLTDNTFEVFLHYDMDQLSFQRQQAIGFPHDSLPPEIEDLVEERFSFEIWTGDDNTQRLDILKRSFDRTKFDFEYFTSDTFWGGEKIRVIDIKDIKLDALSEIYCIVTGPSNYIEFEQKLQTSEEDAALFDFGAQVTSLAVPAMAATAVTTAVLGIGTVQPFYDAVNAAQVVNVMPLMNTFIPQETVKFWNGLGVSNLNSGGMQQRFDNLGQGAKVAATNGFRMLNRWLQIEETTEAEATQEDPVNWRFKRENYPCKDIFCNGGDVLLFWGILMLAVVINMLIVLISLGKTGCICGFIHRVSYKYHLQTRWNMWIRGVLETMLVLGLTAMTNLLYGVPYTFQYYFSIVILSTIGYTYIFIWLFIIFRRKQIYTRDKTTVMRYGILFNEMKTESFWDLLYYPFFMTRRAVFVVLILFLQDWPRTQCGVLFTMCLATLVYLAYFKPFTRRHILAINIANELFITLTVFVSFYFVKPQYGLKNKVLGYILIGLVVAMIGTNIIAFVINLIINIIQWRRERAKIPKDKIYYGQTKQGGGSLSDTTSMGFTGAPDEKFDPQEPPTHTDIRTHISNHKTHDELIDIEQLNQHQAKLTKAKHYDDDGLDVNQIETTPIPTFKNKDFIEY